MHHNRLWRFKYNAAGTQPISMFSTRVPPPKVSELWKSTTLWAGTFWGDSFYLELYLDPGPCCWNTPSPTPKSLVPGESSWCGNGAIYFKRNCKRNVCNNFKLNLVVELVSVVRSSLTAQTLCQLLKNLRTGIGNFGPGLANAMGNSVQSCRITSAVPIGIFKTRNHQDGGDITSLQWNHRHMINEA